MNDIWRGPFVVAMKHYEKPRLSESYGFRYRRRLREPFVFDGVVPSSLVDIGNEFLEHHNFYLFVLREMMPNLDSGPVPWVVAVIAPDPEVVEHKLRDLACAVGHPPSSPIWQCNFVKWDYKHSMLYRGERELYLTKDVFGGRFPAEPPSSVSVGLLTFSWKLSNPCSAFVSLEECRV